MNTVDRELGRQLALAACRDKLAGAMLNLGLTVNPIDTFDDLIGELSALPEVEITTDMTNTYDPDQYDPFNPPSPTDDTDRERLSSVQRLSRDLALAGTTLTDTQARYLVDAYYIMQEDRKRTRNQERALGTDGEPHQIITWLADQAETLEKQIIKALDTYSRDHLMGPYLRGIHGVGPVIAAGLLAHLYVGEWCNVCHSHNKEHCERRQQRTDKKKTEPHPWSPEEHPQTVGHWWAYAGVAGDGQKAWEPNTKRPWNAELKTLLWRLGDVLVKFSNNEKSFYGQVYRERKLVEVANNTAGNYKAIAAVKLEKDLAYEKRTRKPAREKTYHEQGLLSPGHLDLRARRVAVKLLLAHLHEVWYEKVFGKKPPLPYPVAQLGHAHQINPPPTP